MNSIIIQLKQQVIDLAQILLNKKEADSLRARLVRGATGTFFINVTVKVLLFIQSLLLARLLGTSGYGIYAYVLAWVTLLGVPAALGLEKLLVRNISVYQAQSAWSLMKGFLRWSLQKALFASLGLALLMALVTFVLKAHFNPEILAAFWVALLSLPVMTLMRLKRSIMQGLHHVVSGQVPEMIAQPVLFIILFVASYFFLENRLTPTWTVGIYVVSAGVALLAITQMLRKAIPKQTKQSSAEYQTRVWIRSALPLLLVGGLAVINSQTDVLMLGAMIGTESVGIYNVAAGGAALITFILISINMALGHNVASLYAKKEMKRLQRVVTKSARITLLLSLPIAIGMIGFGYWYLLLFGQDFTQGRTALTILSVGQLINIAMGSVGLLLVMTGHERDAAIGVAISAGLNIILNAILIPYWGMVGAAIATTSSLILWNILFAIWLYKRTGIYSTAMGKIRFGKGA